jgi:S1-C subfamily serine protease
VRRAVIRFSLLGIVLMTAMDQWTVAQPRRALTVSELVKRSNGAVAQNVTAGRDGKELALGSGFFVAADGKVVTNFHVIDGAHSAIAKLVNVKHHG